MSRTFVTHTFLSHVTNSSESVTRVKNCEEFAYSFEFFTRLKLDICEKFVLITIKIDGAYISHLQICDVLVLILHMHVTNTKCEK